MPNSLPRARQTERKISITWVSEYLMWMVDIEGMSPKFSEKLSNVIKWLKKKGYVDKECL